MQGDRERMLSVDEAMSTLRERFDPRAAAGWRATFHYHIGGAERPEWTVRVDDGSCSVVEGHDGDADCTVSLSQATFLGLQAGKLDPQTAFLFGRIRVSDLDQMMRFVQAFGF